jgi:hypothetical protein
MPMNDPPALSLSAHNHGDAQLAQLKQWLLGPPVDLEADLSSWTT